jgi:uncharacterized protein (TIGR03435 family)
MAAMMALAAVGQTPLVFDVTSVKPHPGEDTSSRIRLEDSGVRAENMTLLRLVMTAYAVTEQQVVDVPRWAREERWDLQAKSLELPATPTPDQVVPLLRKLLEDRFNLRVHREPRPMPVYRLSVNQGTSKLTRSTSDQPGGANVTAAAGGITMQMRATDMDEFARILSRRVDRPVVNQTALNGLFDFSLAWTPEMTEGAQAGPSVFTAIREQLGLRLEAGREPVDVLVFDSATRPESN